jgi:hypothetical protein
MINMKPRHHRKLAINLISLTMARLNRQIHEPQNAVRDELEAIVTSSDYLKGAPFLWVLLSIRLGLKDSEKPIYQGINKTHGDLSMAIEIDTHKLIDADLLTIETILKNATLIALIHAGKKYKLPTLELEALQGI